MLSESMDIFQTPKLPTVSPKRETSPRWIGLAGPPPPSPLRWKWTCHKCRQTYPLGATRRCLTDGHYFCSGNGSSATNGLHSPRRNRASCTSEFDYIGWTAHNAWRRKELRARERMTQAAPRLCESVNETICNEMAMRRGRASTRTSRDCEQCCDYPSECQWERSRQVERARSESEVTSDATQEEDAMPRSVPTSFEEMIDLNMTDVDSGLEQEQLHSLTREAPSKPAKAEHSSNTGKLQQGLRAILSRERIRWAPKTKSY